MKPKSKKSKDTKAEIKVVKYTWKAPPQTKKQIEEMLLSEKDKKRKQHSDLRDIAIFLEGMLKGNNISPIGTEQLKSLWNVILELRH